MSESSSWVYLVSQFTPEALVIEGLLICLLAAGYSAFWLLRKRRHGVIKHDVPAGVVKEYLIGLIQEAEFIRMQLFGLLQAGGMPQGLPNRSSLAGMMGAGDPKALAELEGKLSEQQRALDKVINEKIQLESELVAAKAAGAGGGANPELEEKLKSLQARLDEYSIIEDDLANLKKLTQENTTLKAQLAALQAGGASAPAVTVAATAAVVAATAPAAAAPEPIPDPEPTPVVEPEAEPEPAPSAPAEEPTPPPANDSPLEMATEGIQTGTSQEEPPISAVAQNTPTPPPSEEAATPGPEGDLVAEFEKILSG